MVLQDWPRLEPGVGQVRIRTAACGICATDLAMIDGLKLQVRGDTQQRRSVTIV